MRAMVDVPPEEIEQAEGAGGAAGHSHAGVTYEDGSLAEHLGAVHAREVDPGLGAATQEGLHDRLHSVTKAADE